MRSKAYWLRRTTALEKSLQKQAAEVSGNVIKAYERAIENINIDIENTFKAYLGTGVPSDEARKLIRAAESDKSYMELLKLYRNTANAEVRADIMNRINAQAYGARMSRLEDLKSKIYISLIKAANQSEKAQTEFYSNVINKSYYTNIYNIARGLNVGINFSILPQRAIDRVLSEPWYGENYSDRIWKHNDRFITALQRTLEDGIIAGHSVNRMAENLKDYVNEPNGIYTSAQRLVRSETSHFMNQGQLAAYEEIGIEKYQYVAAFGERTCDVCGNLDGEIFNVADAMEGENFPPLHAQCRCVTVIAGDNPAERIARDPLTGENYKVDGDMTFNEWKNSLTDEQQAALKYVDKSVQDGIINKRGDMVIEYTQLGKIETDLFEKEFGTLRTNEIIITNERVEHIKSHHPDDYELFLKYGADTVKNPDEIIRDMKNEGTVFLIKHLEYTNLNVVSRLILQKDNEKLKNSVMTFYRIRQKNLVKLEKKNKILYKKE